MSLCAPCLLACFLTFTCTACTVVEVRGGELRRYGGSLRLDPFGNAATVAITTRNYGLAVDGHSLLLGYGKSRTIVVPDTSRCSAVIIVERSSAAELMQWRNYFSQYPDVCVEGGEK